MAAPEGWRPVDRPHVWVNFKMPTLFLSLTFLLHRPSYSSFSPRRAACGTMGGEGEKQSNELWSSSRNNNNNNKTARFFFRGVYGRNNDQPLSRCSRTRLRLCFEGWVDKSAAVERRFQFVMVPCDPEWHSGLFFCSHLIESVAKWSGGAVNLQQPIGDSDFFSVGRGIQFNPTTVYISDT